MSNLIFSQNCFFVFACSFLLLGCENQKYSQCQEIIAIVNQTTQQVKEISGTSTGKPIAPETWLKAADSMNLAAKEIGALPIKDPQLISYQSSLADVFRVYSESTYEAVEARERKDRSALELARDKANQIGKLNQDLISQIDSYCQAK